MLSVILCDPIIEAMLKVLYRTTNRTRMRVIILVLLCPFAIGVLAAFAFSTFTCADVLHTVVRIGHPIAEGAGMLRLVTLLLESLTAVRGTVSCNALKACVFAPFAIAMLCSLKLTAIAISSVSTEIGIVPSAIVAGVRGAVINRLGSIEVRAADNGAI